MQKEKKITPEIKTGKKKIKLYYIYYNVKELGKKEDGDE